MTKREILVVVALLFWIFPGLGLIWNASVEAQTDFYKGKTIRIVVGSTSGGLHDLWARLLARYLPKHIAGSPEIIAQNMAGAGGMIASNYIYGVAKADGLTIGLISPSLFFNQIGGHKEVQFDWGKFTWIGSPEETVETLAMRSGVSYETLDEIRKATVPPRCAATAPGTTTHYFPRLLEEVAGLKFNIVTGYPGPAEIDLAMQRGEVHCRAVSAGAIFAREPIRTWVKTGFIRVLVVGGDKRDPRAPDAPTVLELMEKHKTADLGKRVATVLLSPGSFGRPFVGGPGMPADRVKILRDSFVKTMNDPELLAEAEKRGWEVSPVRGEKLEALAREVVTQPPEVVSRMNAVLGK